MIQEIKSYMSVLDSLPKELNNSPYKMGHIVKTIGMNNATFYRKLKNKTFTAHEVLKIAEVIRPQEVYKAELLEGLRLAKEQCQNGETVSHQEAMEHIRSLVKK